MGAISVRRLDEAVIERIKAKAKANHRSMEEEIRDSLTRSYAEPLRGQAAVDYFRQHREAVFGDRVIEGVTETIRQMRYGEEDPLEDEYIG